ncbi:hypothetical protein HO173_004936 [Letharia columbiana]|uniref:Uncharacterized protein n=1 Tax=Letharia columbiana TaxID=112416 RepID=A0A8H6FXH5_9LECA|nr:uncharacterized protein HO173_004936 [Letharia columbiana]KAF6236645.1 hypothetical protein HO173_004936 [Letharia columbiana]
MHGNRQSLFPPGRWVRPSNSYHFYLGIGAPLTPSWTVLADRPSDTTTLTSSTTPDDDLTNDAQTHSLTSNASIPPHSSAPIPSRTAPISVNTSTPVLGPSAALYPKPSPNSSLGIIDTDAWIHEIFSSAEGRPYDRDWTSKHNVSEDILMEVPSKHKIKPPRQTRCRGGKATRTYRFLPAEPMRGICAHSSGVPRHSLLNARSQRLHQRQERGARSTIRSRSSSRIEGNEACIEYWPGFRDFLRRQTSTPGVGRPESETGRTQQPGRRLKHVEGS